eukprot:2560710-Pleurochrysis_carterae.AAC.1
MRKKISRLPFQTVLSVAIGALLGVGTQQQLGMWPVLPPRVLAPGRSDTFTHDAVFTAERRQN